ncbi:acetoin utilization protein [Paramagnetospirillum marisnigri]|uniref:Acetoin utilization protein n=1 Tax=Paramagnetospirillum marisnigri TaxID=1285242 RepID=A0A178MTU2_9PROT|nr:histone deacetylase family protein [Paramagnetospirillum marisnigri]OAN53678.1 acetoin utilization protein [Paramagnetospirillum marisnigri]
MTTLLFTHPVCLQHDTGDYHPECADRIKAVLAALEAEEFSTLPREEAPHATMEQLMRAHPLSHIDYVLDSVPNSDSHHHLDPDTILSRYSGEAALRAAGGAVAAVDAVAKGLARNAFCAVRPPGHHAERDAAMGFCFFNNAAVAALHARDAHGFKRVAVVDFDVHHGNGTQHILWDEAGTFYASTHQEHAFPNTGFPEETGGDGIMVNVPLPPGTGSADYRVAFSDILLPKLRAFQPDFLIISAGFDAHAADPLAHLRLTTADFGWITRQLLDVASEFAGNRVVSVLEGGYDLRALAVSVREHVRALMGL